MGSSVPSDYEGTDFWIKLKSNKENSVNSLKKFLKAKDEQHSLKSILEKKRSKSKMGRNLVTGTKIKKHKTKKRSKKKKVYAKSNLEKKKQRKKKRQIKIKNDK